MMWQKNTWLCHWQFSFFFEINFTWFETVLRLTFKQSKSMLINKYLEIAMMIFEIECACLKLGVFFCWIEVFLRCWILVEESKFCVSEPPSVFPPCLIPLPALFPNLKKCEKCAQTFNFTLVNSDIHLITY